MSIVQSGLLGSFAAAILFFGACGGQSDYQGGGRRTDLGRGTDSAIALNAGGNESAGGSAGSSGAASAGTAGVGRAGYAGCSAGGDGGQGFFADCTP